MQSPVHMSNASGSWCRVLAACLPLAVSACATLPEAPIPTPTGTRSALVVLDIDGTLTPHNLRVHEARPGAAETVRAFESRGYEIAYITARVPAFQASLPGWLAEHGFPAGNLHVAQSREDRRRSSSKFREHPSGCGGQRGTGALALARLPVHDPRPRPRRSSRGQGRRTRRAGRRRGRGAPFDCRRSAGARRWCDARARRRRRS